MTRLTYLNDSEGRAWLSSIVVLPAYAGEGDAGGGGDAGGSAGGAAADSGAGGGDASGDGAGAKPAASGKGGKKAKGESTGDDPIGEALRRENAGLNRKLEARTEELERSRKKYDHAVTAIGGEDKLEEFRTWESEREKEKDTHLRKEGEFDKLESKLRGENDGFRQEILSLKLGSLRKEIERELSDAAGHPDIEAVNPRQIVRLYGDDMTLDMDENSNTYGRYVHRSEYNDQGERMSAFEFLESERSGAGANLFKSTLKPGSGAADGSSVDGGAVSVKMVGGAMTPEDVSKYERAVSEGRQVRFIHADA